MPVLSIILWVLSSLVSAYIVILFMRMILSWVRVLAPRWYPRGVVYWIIDIVFRVTDPPLRFLRRFIPPLRMGMISLDISFIVLYFVLIVVQFVLQWII